MEKPDKWILTIRGQGDGVCLEGGPWGLETPR
jgi:hypothetical protein